MILEIEIQGARKIKKKFPEAVLVFVTAPSMEELKERLVGRGTETAEVIHQRLARAAQEAEGVDEYDYLLVNDQLEDAVDRLHNIIQSEHFAMRRNLVLSMRSRHRQQSLWKNNPNKEQMKLP